MKKKKSVVAVLTGVFLISGLLSACIPEMPQVSIGSSEHSSFDYSANPYGSWFPFGEELKTEGVADHLVDAEPQLDPQEVYDRIEYNPILFYGGSGLGKTHLMQAIGNYIYNNGGEKLKICYVSAETFTNEFTSSLHYKNPNEFKNKYRNLDVLLLDDIHFLSEKEATQEELFYTFEALFNKNAQMVFTCDRPIKEIKSMADRLVSRLSKGLCIDITIPNFETRCAILQKKIEQKEKVLSKEIIEYIAKQSIDDFENVLANMTIKYIFKINSDGNFYLHSFEKM